MQIFISSKQFLIINNHSYKEPYHQRSCFLINIQCMIYFSFLIFCTNSWIPKAFGSFCFLFCLIVWQKMDISVCFFFFYFRIHSIEDKKLIDHCFYHCHRGLLVGLVWFFVFFFIVYQSRLTPPPPIQAIIVYLFVYRYNLSVSGRASTCLHYHANTITMTTITTMSAQASGSDKWQIFK